MGDSKIVNCFFDVLVTIKKGVARPQISPIIQFATAPTQYQQQTLMDDGLLISLFRDVIQGRKKPHLEWRCY